ncbi:MAG: ribulose-phosphate 3-epimerase [Treponema sp.]|jgi:ribulose-phosphate 3-epimerase|nr:ribulose-phosphate 3-epimerase [Treponema sp.]
MRKPAIIPSIASADPLNLAGEIDRLGGVKKLHLDIEDGNFVPNITFGMKTVRRVAGYVGESAELDAHLIVTSPECWIDELADCGIKKIAFHPEAVRYPLEILHRIRRRGLEAGFGLDFISSIERIRPFVPDLDYVIVMTAEPDGRGMRFNPRMLEKIREAVKLLGPEKEVWADGGIGEDTISAVAAAGASNIILGRAVFSAPDPRQKIEELAALL